MLIFIKYFIWLNSCDIFNESWLHWYPVSYLNSQLIQIACVLPIKLKNKWAVQTDLVYFGDIEIKIKTQKLVSKCSKMLFFFLSFSSTRLVFAFHKNVSLSLHGCDWYVGVYLLLLACGQFAVCLRKRWTTWKSWAINKTLIVMGIREEKKKRCLSFLIKPNHFRLAIDEALVSYFVLLSSPDCFI